MRPPDCARLLLHFSLTHEYEEFEKLCTLVHAPVEGADVGFLPSGVFHRLCAGALGCSNQAATGPEMALERKYAYVAFDDELVILQHMPAISSIAVFLHSDGMRTGAVVLDRLRVLIAQELGEYRNLRCRILGHFLGGEGFRDTWIDLDFLAQTPHDMPHPVTIASGQQVSLQTVRNALDRWTTKGCDFYFLDADKLRAATPEELPSMLRFQELLASPTTRDWLVKRPITLEGVCSRKYVTEYLAVSLRCHGKRQDSSATAEQLQKILGYLQKKPQIKYVYISSMAMPLPPHHGISERSELTRMLPNIPLVYLGCSVLVVLDAFFVGRFWFGLEMWLSLQTASPSGLVSASDQMGRCEVVCLDGTPTGLPKQVRAEWHERDANTAYYYLNSPDLLVSNASDREVTLFKVLQMTEMVRAIIALGSQTAAPVASKPRVLPMGTATDPEVMELKRLFADGGSHRGGAPVDATPASPILTAVAEVSQEVAGLRALLEGLKLASHMDMANNWCKEQGLESVAEVKEAEMGKELAEAMQLKPGKVKLLVKRWAEI